MPRFFTISKATSQIGVAATVAVGAAIIIIVVATPSNATGKIPVADKTTNNTRLIIDTANTLIRL